MVRSRIGSIFSHLFYHPVFSIMGLIDNTINRRENDAGSDDTTKRVLPLIGSLEYESITIAAGIIELDSTEIWPQQAPVF
jgi:hypothetical protein